MAKSIMSFVSLLLILGFAADASAQSVAPTNATIPPPQSGVGLTLLLSDTRMRQTRFPVIPLTKEAGLNESAVALQVRDNLLAPLQITRKTSTDQTS